MDNEAVHEMVKTLTIERAKERVAAKKAQDRVDAIDKVVEGLRALYPDLPMPRTKGVVEAPEDKDEEVDAQILFVLSSTTKKLSASEIVSQLEQYGWQAPGYPEHTVRSALRGLEAEGKVERSARDGRTNEFTLTAEEREATQAAMDGVAFFDAGGS